uniref:Uncharacterized protein n=1 Tax=Anguilla anguilla TaxID=7936 RepID=A0A0E9UMW6_ANGAN
MSQPHRAVPYSQRLNQPRRNVLQIQSQGRPFCETRTGLSRQKHSSHPA